MGWNQKLNRFYYYSGASEEDNMLVLDGSTGAEQGGESLGDVEAALYGKAEPDTTPAPDTSADITSDPSTQSPTTGETTSPETETPPEQPAEPDPALDNPDESEASYAGSVVVVGTRAMEIPTADESIITSYAKAVDDLAGAMGENTRTISLITPNGGEFYSPESLHTGLHSQKDMIDLCYSKGTQHRHGRRLRQAPQSHGRIYLFPHRPPLDAARRVLRLHRLLRGGGLRGRAARGL